MISIKQRIDEIRSSLQPLLKSEARASVLQNHVPDAELFIGISGIEYKQDSFEIIPGFLTIRSITNPPGIVHVCRASNLDQSDYLGVARYSHTIKAEITCGKQSFQILDDPQFFHDLAWNTAALIKLRGHQTLVGYCSSTVSWDTVQAITDHSVLFLILDDVPRQLQVDDIRCVSSQDLIWVRENYNRALRLRDASESRRFGLAFNLAYTWNHTSNSRIAVANIWSGLEALFGVQTDRPVSQMLVERIAAWLNGVSESEIGDLYNHRCDAVHGRLMQEDEIIDVIRKSADLLRRSLVQCIERDEKTLPDWGA